MCLSTALSSTSAAREARTASTARAARAARAASAARASSAGRPVDFCKQRGRSSLQVHGLHKHKSLKL